MLAVGTPKGLSLVFTNKNELQIVIDHLTNYLNHLTNENEGAVYTISSSYIPENEVKEITMWLKEVFTKSD